MVKSCDGSSCQVLGHNIAASTYMLDQDPELQEELLIELSFVRLSIIDSYPHVFFQCLSIFQFTSHDFHVHLPPVSSCTLASNFKSSFS
jgi:hypothetical protein